MLGAQKNPDFLSVDRISQPELIPAYYYIRRRSGKRHISVCPCSSTDVINMNKEITFLIAI